MICFLPFLLFLHSCPRRSSLSLISPPIYIPLTLIFIQYFSCISFSPLPSHTRFLPSFHLIVLSSFLLLSIFTFLRIILHLLNSALSSLTLPSLGNSRGPSPRRNLLRYSNRSHTAEMLRDSRILCRSRRGNGR